MNVRLLKKRHAPPPHPALRLARVAGGVILILAGLVMLVTPGQGLLTILLGLWVMSADVRIAKRALLKVRIMMRRARRRYRSYRESSGKRGS